MLTGILPLMLLLLSTMHLHQHQSSNTHWSSAAVWLLAACSLLLMTIMGYVTMVAAILAEAPAECVQTAWMVRLKSHDCFMQVAWQLLQRTQKGGVRWEVCTVDASDADYTPTTAAQQQTESCYKPGGHMAHMQALLQLLLT